MLLKAMLGGRQRGRKGTSALITRLVSNLENKLQRFLRNADQGNVIKQKTR
jgi:hypothetical protein